MIEVASIVVAVLSLADLPLVTLKNSIVELQYPGFFLV